MSGAVKMREIMVAYCSEYLLRLIYPALGGWYPSETYVIMAEVMSKKLPVMSMK